MATKKKAAVKRRGKKTGVRVTLQDLESIGIFEHEKPKEGFYIKPLRLAIGIEVSFSGLDNFHGPLDQLSLCISLGDEMKLEETDDADALLATMNERHDRFNLRIHVAQLLATTSEWAGNELVIEPSTDDQENSFVSFSKRVGSREDILKFVTFVQHFLRFTNTAAFGVARVALGLERKTQLSRFTLHDLR